MKKIFKLMLVLALVVTQFIGIAPVSAATNDNSGTITINPAVPEKEYSVYQILKLESYDVDKEAYIYVIEQEISEGVTNPWWTFLNLGEIKNVYVKITPTTINGKTLQVVTWVEGADKVAFADKAMVFAKTKSNNVTATQTTTATTTTVKFTGLNLGYYLVDSSLGALCGLTTTRPDANIYEKNGIPTVDKMVEEDSNKTYGSSNTAQIGQTVNFQTTIYATVGAENYVLNDVMSDGLTLNRDSIKVQLITKNDDDTTETRELTAGTDYTVAYDVEIDEFKCTTDECEKVNADFQITFTESLADTLTDKHEILVTYSAVLNEDAVISDDANPNDTWLEYGDDNKSNKDTTETFTFRFDVVKTDDSETPIMLDGAVFKLYDALTGGNEIKVVWDAERNAYRVAKSDEQENAVAIEATNGTAEIIGLDAATTYYLEEIEAPDGYNKLTTRTPVAIEDKNLDAIFGKDNEQNPTYDGGGVQVVNTKGAVLPETGGMGTVMFITVGSLMVMGFGVLLVTKLRLSKES